MLSGKLGEIARYAADEWIGALVCCASFEERCLSIPHQLSRENVGRMVLFVNKDYRNVAEGNVEILKRKFAEKCNLLELNTGDPILTADRIQEGFRGLKEDYDGGLVLIDITAFTRESMMIMLRYLAEDREFGVRVRFVYTRAMEYSIGDSVEEKWLSRGHREIRSVLGYSGMLAPSKRNHLVVMVGFEEERALALVHECEPAVISLGIADESDWATGPHQETNVQRLKRLENEVGEVRRFTFSGYDALATKKQLAKVVGQVVNHNTIIAPMNTKLSTLGAAVFALENDAVQICYSQADMYNVSRYSIPGDHFFCVDFEELVK